MFNRILLLLGGGLLGFCAQAAELDVTLGNDSLRGEYVAPMGKKVADNVSTLDIGLLYNEEREVDMMLGHIGLMIYGDTGARKANVQAGLGGRAIFLDVDKGESGFAVALGGTLHARMPDLNRLGGRVWMFYAPDVSSFDEIDGFVEYGFSVDYQLIRQAALTIGYRNLEAEVDGVRDLDLESGGFVGLRFVF